MNELQFNFLIGILTLRAPDINMAKVCVFVAAMTMPALVLQKPHSKSKVKDHVKCLEDNWKTGKLAICQPSCLKVGPYNRELKDVINTIMTMLLQKVFKVYETRKD